MCLQTNRQMGCYVKERKCRREEAELEKCSARKQEGSVPRTLTNKLGQAGRQTDVY